MKPEEVELCREAFKLYKKGYRILTKLGKNKGEYTAYQVRLENETELFEKLKNVIPEGIIKQIDTSNKPSRCTCLIGKDSDLIDGVVSYILHFHDFKARLNYRNYTSVTSVDIETELFKGYVLVNRYFRGESLFLRGLEDVGILRRLVSIIRDYTGRDIHGFLFVSVENDADLPEEFKSLFDVVELDHTSEGDKKKPVTKKKAKMFYDANNGILFLDNKRFLELGRNANILVETLNKCPQDANGLIDKVNEQNTYRDKFTPWKRTNFDEQVSRTNKEFDDRFQLGKLFVNSSNEGEYELSVKLANRDF